MGWRWIIAHYWRATRGTYNPGVLMLPLSCWGFPAGQTEFHWIAMNPSIKVTSSGTNPMPINLPIRNPISPTTFDVLLTISLLKNGCPAFLCNEHLKLHKRFHLDSFLPGPAYDILLKGSNLFSPGPSSYYTGLLGFLTKMLSDWDALQVDNKIDQCAYLLALMSHHATWSFLTLCSMERPILI